jgi:hypothetical protein
VHSGEVQWRADGDDRQHSAQRLEAVEGHESKATDKYAERSEPIAAENAGTRGEPSGSPSCAAKGMLGFLVRAARGPRGRVVRDADRDEEGDENLGVAGGRPRCGRPEGLRGPGRPRREGPRGAGERGPRGVHDERADDWYRAAESDLEERKEEEEGRPRGSRPPAHVKEEDGGGVGGHGSAGRVCTRGHGEPERTVGDECVDPLMARESMNMSRGVLRDEDVGIQVREYADPKGKGRE